MCTLQSGIRPDQQATSSCQVEHRLHPIGTMAALPQTSGCCCPADAVICPVCCKANLAELQGIIACPRGDVRLDLRTEQLNLQDLRHRLASVLEVSRLPFSWGCPSVIYPLSSLLDSAGWCRGCHTASSRESSLCLGCRHITPAALGGSSSPRMQTLGLQLSGQAVAGVTCCR